MLESGLGLRAACLPAQYGLVKSQEVQSLVRSVQSAISLRSQNSPKHSVQRSKTSSQLSQEHIVTHAEGPARNDHVLEMGRIPQEHEILVTHDLEQARDIEQG